MSYWQKMKETDGFLLETEEVEAKDKAKSPTDLRWLVVTLFIALILNNISCVTSNPRAYHARGNPLLDIDNSTSLRYTMKKER